MADIKKIKVGDTTYDIKDATAVHDTKKLNTNNNSVLTVNSSEAIAGSGTISLNGISKTAQEEYLQWGGPSKSGAVSPIGMTLSNEHSANRMAFINGDLITAEYSSDGGTTWTAYSADATAKSKFFTQSQTFAVGRPDASTEVTADKSKTRFTITAQNGNNPSGRVYTDPRKMLILVSTATALELLVEYRTGTNYKNNGAWSTFGTYSLTGWSGWNDIPLVLNTLGGGADQLGNNWQLRLTFTVKTKNTSYPKTASILAARIYGQNTWSTPSTLAETGHMYTFDMSKNVTFPAGVSAKSFTEGGTSLANKYLGKTAKAADADKLDGNDSTYYLNYNNLSNKPTIPTVPTALKNPNSITFKAGSETVLSYDGSAAKTFTIDASTTNGAFTISDGTTTKTVQLAGKFTDNNTTYSAGTGLQLSGTTFSANLDSTTSLGTIGTTSKLYAVGVDANGKLAVNVPWTDTNTDTHNSHAIISGTKSDNSTQIKGSASSGDITLGDSGVTAGAYGDTADQTPGYNATFKVPSISVNAKGIVTAIGEHTVTIPDNSSLVPYTGAANDVNLGNHSLLISDQTAASGPIIKISGKSKTEDDTSITIKSTGIEFAGSTAIKALLVRGALNITDNTNTALVNKGGFEAKFKEDPDGDGHFDTYSSKYGYDGITHNGKKLLLPEKEGTIALTNDLSTLLDKGTSSSLDFQTVYNPVTFMHSTTTPSINGINTSVGAVGFPWELGGTTSTSSVSSALTLRGYEDSLKKECYTILTQDGNEFSIKAKNDSMSSILSYNGQWRIGGNQIVTADMMPRTQQWKLTSTSGTVTTVNICTE